jgi:hypothetical protein
MRSPFMRLTAAFVLMLAVSGVAIAQDTSALINEQLDKLVDLDFGKPVTLPDAISAIEKQTGVPLRVQPPVWALLPWGEQTNFTAKIEHRSLREALSAILQKLGLTFAVRDEAVEIQPLPALARLGRRSTVQELQALDLLASTPLGNTADQLTIAALVEQVDAKLVEAKAPFAVENRVREDKTRPVVVPRGSTLLEALESLHKDTASTWYPWGKTILVSSKEDQIRNLLARTITTRYNGVDIAQVLLELSRHAGVPFSIEPGALQRIPPESRTVRLVLDNVSVQQTLDTIAGFTGLGYELRADGVYLWSQNPGAPAGRDSFVGLLTLDNGMQVVVRESQLPPDLREYIRYRQQKAIDNLREMMIEEGFTPTTQPASQPADQPSPDL